MDENSCNVPINIDSLGGDPCVGVQKAFAVQVTCDVNGYEYSNWNFSLIS